VWLQPQKEVIAPVLLERVKQALVIIVHSCAGRWDETPVAASSSRWDSSASTPVAKGGAAAGGRSRWDETPVAGPLKSQRSTTQFAYILAGGGATPVGGFSMLTPTPSQLASMTPEQYQMHRNEMELGMRNRCAHESS
jgi:hypothetical protein